MRHDWEVLGQYSDPRATQFVCKRCGMECVSVDKPKREKVVAWVEHEGRTQRIRFNCDEYLLYQAMET